MTSIKIKKMCTSAFLLASFNACAALYQVQSTGVVADVYINETQATGQFSSLGILPLGSQVKSASVQFLFQDEADGTEYLHGSNHPQIGDEWVEQPVVYSGYDIYHNHLRDYYRINESLWRYERETVSILLGGLSLGAISPAATSTTNRSETPGPLVWDHGGSSRYVYAYDSDGVPILGTKYYDYYNKITYVDESRYIGNELDFSLFSALDANLFALLENGGALDFMLDVTSGDLLFKSATLFIETFNDGEVPEPSTLLLALAGLVGIGLLSRPADPPVRGTARR